jgi:hypothetical protein
MRVSLLTQNLGGSSDATFNLSEFIEKGPTADPDIYVEFSQEDNRKLDGTSLINPIILKNNNYTFLAQESLNGHTKAKQNIVSTVFVKSDVNVNVLNQGQISLAPQPDAFGRLKYLGSFIASSLHTGQGFTKGVVYIKLKIGKTHLLLLNMHLPVITASKNGHPVDPTLGFEYRRISFEYLLNELTKLKLIDSTTTVLIGGDLNFRQDENGLNQLNVLLSGKKGYKQTLARELKELPTPNGSTKRITCKFRNPRAKCRTRNAPKNGFNKEFIKQTQNECGDEQRTPSRCDRFLMMSDLPVDVIYYQSKFIQLESDHNAVLATLDINQRPERTIAKRRLV